MGNAEGAAKSREIALAKNPNHFRDMGSKGGKKAKREDRQFYKDRELAQRAGKIGGTVSRRTKSK